MLWYCTVFLFSTNEYDDYDDDDDDNNNNDDDDTLQVSIIFQYDKTI